MANQSKVVSITRKSSNKLSFRPKKKASFRHLPFLGNEHTPEDAISYWNIPASGGYFGGNKTGEAVAFMLLKHLRENLNNPDSLNEAYLGLMILDWNKRMMAEAPQLDSEGLDSLNGQMVGFINIISKLLLAFAIPLYHELDKKDYKELLKQANQGIAFDEEDYFKYLDLKEQFEEIGMA